MEKLIIEIIGEIIADKKNKKIKIANCTKLELLNEISARREMILEKLINNGILHEGPIAHGVYYIFN